MAATGAGVDRNETVYVAREDGCACRFICWKGVQRWRSPRERYGLKEQTAAGVQMRVLPGA